MDRQALHATRLAFAHPKSGEPVTFNSPAPTDFAQAWDCVLAAAA
jgi:23S rRNA pseudouridine1911/1915/1917 synthase